jgi:hypothetical protein
VKTIFKNSVLVLAIVAATTLLAGCESIGQTPAGGSDADVKAALAAKPLDEQAKIIMSSPAPQEFKMQKVKELYEKAGKEPPANLMQGGGPAPTIPVPASGGN